MPRLIIAAAFLLGSASCLTADIAPLSKDDLREKASHQIIGEVKRVYSTKETKTTRFGPYEYTYYVAEVAVASVEKGSGIDDGDLTYVRCYRIKWKGDGLPPPGHSGHATVPAQGDRVLIYLRQGKDKGHDVLLPNGCTVLTRGSKR